MLSLLAGLLGLGCSKDPANAEGDATTLVGIWELAFSSGGNASSRSYARGNGYLMKLTDSRVDVYVDGEKRWSADYRVVDDSTAAVQTCRTLAPDQFRRALLYNNDPYPHFFQISGRELTILSGCVSADGSLTTYRKISDGTSN